MTPEEEAMVKSLTPEALAKLIAKAAKKVEYNKKWHENNPEHDKKYSKEWYENNSERKKEYCKKWHEDNPEYIKEYNKVWYENNPERGKEHRKRWHEKHSEYMKEYCKKWHKEHPGVAKAANHRRRTRLAGNGGSFTWEEFVDLCVVYEFVCVYCGEENVVNGEVKPLTPDHITAIANGGSGNIDNQYPACLHCNCSKQDKTFEEYVSALPQEQQDEIEMRIFFAENPEEREKMHDERLKNSKIVE
jgi:hypothetical protein